VTLAELGLVVFAVLHIGMGLILFVQNLQARPVRYAVKKRAGGRTIGSITAPYTGFLILVFIIVHLSKFRFVDKTMTDDFIILSSTFSQIGYVLFYILGVAVVALSREPRLLERVSNHRAESSQVHALDPALWNRVQRCSRGGFCIHPDLPVFDPVRRMAS
jgi:hypothetical protein